MKNAVILIGGNSSRMGREKSTIRYHGKPHRQYLYDCLVSMDFDTWFAGRADQQVQRLLPDRYTNRGPISGIYSALTLRKRLVLVVCCDQPLLDSHTLEHLWNNAQKAPNTVYMTCFSRRDGKGIEPFPSVWNRKALPYIEKAMQAKKYALQYILPRQKICAVVCSDYVKLTNVNTANQLHKLRTEYGLESN